MYQYDINTELEEELIEEDEVKEYEIDFTAKKLTGNFVYGAKAVATWAWMALQVQKSAFVQYSSDYGFDINSIVGKTISISDQQEIIQNLLEECLLVNEYIESISDLEVEQSKNHISIKFTLDTIFGSEEVSTDV